MIQVVFAMTFFRFWSDLQKPLHFVGFQKTMLSVYGGHVTFIGPERRLPKALKPLDLVDESEVAPPEVAS